MGDQALVDVVTELRDQNQLIRQQTLNAEAVQVVCAAQEQVIREKKESINDEAAKLEKCEGLPTPIACRHGSEQLMLGVRNETPFLHDPIFAYPWQGWR